MAAFSNERDNCHYRVNVVDGTFMRYQRQAMVAWMCLFISDQMPRVPLLYGSLLITRAGSLTDRLYHSSVCSLVVVLQADLTARRCVAS